MKVTIGICTWNRAVLLDRALTRMNSLRIPEGVSWEVLVANNNSTDDTDAVLRKHSESMPLRRLFEPRPGKSHAANHIVREATGDLILWTDDDVLVDQNWISAYVQASEHQPRACIFGGRVLPDFEQEPPSWVKKNLHLLNNVLALIDHGPEPRLLHEEVPAGANMAQRRSFFDSYSFDVRLGPQPGTEMRGEDSLMLRTARADGRCIAWVPDAIVHHLVPVRRMTQQYMSQYWRGIGASEMIIGGAETERQWFGAPSWLWRAYALAHARASALRVFGRTEIWLRAAMTAQILRGKIEFSRSRRSSGSPRD